MNSNNQGGVESIANKFLSTGDLFGLRFNEGIIFLEVTGWEQNKFSPYTGIPEIASQDNAGFQRLEHEDDDILFIEKRKTKVLHAGIGQAPQSLRRYTNYPEGETRLRSIPNLGIPRPGDDYGYIDGKSSSFGDPTDAEELWITPGTHLDFDFYNPDSEPHTPVLNILMREYNVRPLKKGDSDDKKAIKRIVSPGSPIPIVPAGSPDRQVGYDLKEHWGAEPMQFKEARNL